MKTSHLTQNNQTNQINQSTKPNRPYPYINTCPSKYKMWFSGIFFEILEYLKYFVISIHKYVYIQMQT